jgi:hypothetical protein
MHCTALHCTILLIVTVACLQASVFKHGLIRNPVTVYGVSVSIAVMVLVVYAPFLQVGYLVAAHPCLQRLPGRSSTPTLQLLVQLQQATEHLRVEKNPKPT